VTDDEVTETSHEAAPERPTLTEAQGGSPMLVKAVGTIARRTERGARFADLVAAIVARYSRHRGGILAAGFAYYAILAIVPTAIALGSIAGLVGDPVALREALDRAVERVPSLEGSSSSVFAGIIDVVGQVSSTAFGIATLIGVALAIYASSKVFVTGSQIIDLAFERPLRPRSWLVRVVAAVAVLALLVGLVALVVVAQAVPAIQRTFGIADTWSGASLWLASIVWIAVAYVAFAVALRFGAPREANVRFFSTGAALATAVAAVGGIGTIIYINLSSGVSAAIAVLGGAIVVQLLLYVIGIAVIYGAECEAVRAFAESRSDDGADTGGSGPGDEGVPGPRTQGIPPAASRS
jgi:membrane protein